MRYHDNRKTDLLGIQSSSTIKNGVFTNPQKSNLNKRTRAKNKIPITNHFGEEYPLSIRSFSTNKIDISSKALAHSKRKSSITYLNKHSFDDRHGAFQDDIQIRENTKNYLNTNLQRSLSKRQIPDFISANLAASSMAALSYSVNQPGTDNTKAFSFILLLSIVFLTF